MKIVFKGGEKIYVSKEVAEILVGKTLNGSPISQWQSFTDENGVALMVNFAEILYIIDESSGK